MVDRMGSMFKRLIVIVSSLVLLISAGAASATTTAPLWVVTPGGQVTGTSGTVTLALPAGTFTCSSSRMVSTLASSDTNTVATLPQGSVAFVNCTPFTLTPIGIWKINLISIDPVTGDVTGVITNITVRVSGPGCTATVVGSVGFVYSNTTHVLRVTNSNLTVSAVSGCLGLLAVGQHATLNLSYLFNPPQVFMPGS